MAHLQRVGAIMVALGAVASSATADGPTISMLLTANGQSTSLSLTGGATGSPTVFNYHGTATSGGAGWMAAWNFNASNTGTSDGLDRAYTAGNFLVVNTSNSTIVFDVALSMPVSLVGSGLFHGSVSAVMTTQGAGSFGTAGDSPIWTASSADSTIATLLHGPMSAERTTTGSSTLGVETFGDPVPTGRAFDGDLSVRMRFTLSAGATASFTSVLVGTVPTPGAAALLGLGGLLMNGRRRRV